MVERLAALALELADVLIRLGNEQQARMVAEARVVELEALMEVPT